MNESENWEKEYKKKVLISGPTGAIGMALIQQLLFCGCQVTAITHRGSVRNQRFREAFGKDMEDGALQIVECDLSELSTLRDHRMSSYDWFYHLAWMGTTGMAREDVRCQEQNIRYTLDAVELAAAVGCTRFIGVGSQAEYGIQKEVLSEKTPTCPKTGYGIAKLTAGQLSRKRCQQLGMAHIWVRVLSVYGPYDTERSVVMTVIRNLIQGCSPACTKGEQIWDFLYSEDAARALILLGEKGKDGEIYCLGSGSGRMLRYYIEEIQTIAEKICQRPMPPIHFGAIDYGEDPIRYLQADISQLTSHTGFVPKVSFAEGIERTVTWCRKDQADE